MIEIVGLEKAFGEKILFSATSLRLGARDRIGLVGPNGSGKTTLFRMITQEEHPDRGEILIRKGVHIGYLSQEPMPLQGQTLLEEVQSGVKELSILEDKMRLLEEEISEEKDPETLEALAKAHGHLEERYARRGGYALESQAKAILQGLGFREADFSRSSGELSGGWLMRLALAKILLANPDLLLLDEPTNHLDLQSLIWLEAFLGEYLGTIMIVSHDRDFLNRAVTKILAIEGKKIIPYAGNYDAYVEAREKKRRFSKPPWRASARRSSNFLDVEVVEDRQHVAPKTLHGIGARRHAGFAVAAPVVADHPEQLGQRLHLRFPHLQGSAQRIRQHQGRSAVAALD